MEIRDYETASQKLKWLKSAYQLWIMDQQFLLELKLTLDDEFNKLIPLLKGKKIETKPISEDEINIFFDINDGNTKQLRISYREIEKLYEDITNSVNENLQERLN